MNAKKITFIGIFAALAIVLTLISIPYPLIPFLKFDLSQIVVLIAVTTVGVIPAIFIAFLTAVLNFLFVGPVGPFAIGQVALFLSGTIIACSYGLFMKTLKLSPLVSVILASITFTIAITALNYFWITPVYFGMDFQTALASVSVADFGLGETSTFINPYLTATLLAYIPFNLLNMALVSTLFLAVKKTLVTQIDKFL